MSPAVLTPGIVRLGQHALVEARLVAVLALRIRITRFAVSTPSLLKPGRTCSAREALSSSPAPISITASAICTTTSPLRVARARNGRRRRAPAFQYP